MVRAALTPTRRIGQGPSRVAAYVPAATVVLAAFLAALPIVSRNGWYPDFGYLVFIAWRLLRADPWPAWWAAPHGLVNQQFTGYTKCI
jgi:rod shape-determining protein MreD